jgi:[protein-PII] uridylyltransferase
MGTSQQITDAASLRAAREIAYAEFRETQAVGKLTKQLCKLSDQLLTHLWNCFGLNTEASLVAVGGFGRPTTPPRRLTPPKERQLLQLLPDFDPK